MHSSASVDPDQSGSVANSLTQLQHDDETGSDSEVACAPEKKQFVEQDGLSECSDLHTPAQPSKRRRLPSVTPSETRRVADSVMDSDGMDRDDIFDSTPTRKRGFKRPRKPGSLVWEWNLDHFDREVAYLPVAYLLSIR
jgi:hypothetical protein